MNNILLAGCSFTDPIWQEEKYIPWSVHFAKENPSYIIAKGGMGIHGISTLAYDFIQNNQIDELILLLPTIWRYDYEVDLEYHTMNASVDVLFGNKDGYKVHEKSKRNWLLSYGLHFREDHTDKEITKFFDLMYKSSGWLVMFRNQMKSLKSLLDLCKSKNITYHISSIQDPMDQMFFDDIKQELVDLLNSYGEYQDWFKFDGKFLNYYLGHDDHPSTEEHIQISNYISKNII